MKSFMLFMGLVFFLTPISFADERGLDRCHDTRSCDVQAADSGKVIYYGENKEFPEIDCESRAGSLGIHAVENGEGTMMVCDQLGQWPTIQTKPEIAHEFRNKKNGKIVYKTDSRYDTKPFRLDCSSRGGIFRSCGTSCENDDAPCDAVCVYTCENIPEG